MNDEPSPYDWLDDVYHDIRERVRTCSAPGVAPSLAGAAGSAYLFTAVLFRDFGLFQTLLEFGVDPNWVSEAGGGPMTVADFVEAELSCSRDIADRMVLDAFVEAVRTRGGVRREELEHPSDEPPVSADLRWVDSLEAVDLAALTRLIEDSFRLAADPARVARRFGGSAVVAFAFADGALVGACRCISDGCDTAQIAELAVLPQWRRRGIGKALVERVLTRAGAERVFVESSRVAEAFYLSLGFGRIGAAYVRNERGGPAGRFRRKT